MKKIGLVFVLLLSFVVFIPGCEAQVATGAPLFGSFGGERFDLINLANLNIHFSVPIFSKPGRGMVLSYVLQYDSSVWNPVTIGITTRWSPSYNFGWRNQTSAVTGYVTYRYLSGSCPLYSNWTYYDAVGTPHAIPGVVYTNSSCGPTSGGPFLASDGSGYQMSETSAPSAIVYPPSGGSIIAPVQSNGIIPNVSGSITDANGNLLSINVSGNTTTYVDTLGVTALTATGVPPTSYSYSAPGGTAHVTVNYQAYTVQTAFGVQGIAEYGPYAVNLISSVVLADNTTYTFTYQQTTGACTPLSGTYSANCVDARISKVTFPQGGYISYTYPGGSNGMLSDGSTAGLTRAIYDDFHIFAWQYTRSGSTTTVSDPTSPQTNQTIYTFSGSYETQRQVYQGAISPSNLLKTIVTCYSYSSQNCVTDPVTLPISARGIKTFLPGGLWSSVWTNYSSNGLPTEVDEYSLSTSPTLTRRTVITYASLGNNILNRPSMVVVQDGGTLIASQTTYTYDQSTPAGTSGTPQHVAITGARGNPTTISSWVQGTGQSATYLNKTFTYFDTGALQTSTDVDGAVTVYNYPDPTSTCGNAFPTSVSLPSSLSTSNTFNCNGGVATSTTDLNGQTTHFNFTDSAFWRPSSITDPLGNVTNIGYSGATVTEADMYFNNNNSFTDQANSLDGLGRPHLAQRRQGPNAPAVNQFDSVETNYDATGRPYRVTIPYVGSGGQSNASAAATIYTYDALNRPLLTTDAGGGTVGYIYNQNDVLITLGPAPSGENPKQKQYEYDALGRLTSVCEITSAAGSGPCGQSNPQTGILTTYVYDLLKNITSVTQNAQAAPSAQQTRSFTYDNIGRLTSETNPESGTTYYSYDTDPHAFCPSFPGDLVSKIDAVGTTTCFWYDSLHRLTAKGFWGGPSTIFKYYLYDLSNVGSITIANGKGRLSEAYTATCSTCSKVTDLMFSYSPRGEVADTYQWSQHAQYAPPNQYYHFNATYWPHGLPQTLSATGMTGLPSITYGASDGTGLDGEGRYTKVTASSGQNPIVPNVTYNNTDPSTSNEPVGSPLSVSYGTTGTSDTDVFTWDVNTGRMKTFQANVNGQSDVGTLTWNTNGSLLGMLVNDAITGTNNGESCQYTYDDLDRIATVNCNVPTGWSQSFSYDSFGNIIKSGTLTFHPTYDTSKNRIQGFSYDNDGDLTNDTLHSYSWDAEGKLTCVDNIVITYDALGRMVEQASGGTCANPGTTYTQIVYGPDGTKFALMNVQTLNKTFIPLPGGATAVYNNSGLAYYRHSDWLGSSRLASTPNRTLYYSSSYAPFGESYNETGTTDRSFTRQNQDTVSGLGDFMFREYSASQQGRWISPDPAGLSAVNITNPQTWNRYVYALNDPIDLVDPLGLDPAPAQFICFGDNCNVSNQQFIEVGPDGELVSGDGTGVGGVHYRMLLDQTEKKCPSKTASAINRVIIGSLFTDAFIGANAYFKSGGSGIVQIGIGASAAAPIEGTPISGAAQGGYALVFDSGGNIGLTINYGGGPGLGVGFVAGFEVSRAKNATSMWDVQGVSKGWSGGVGDDIGFSAGKTNNAGGTGSLTVGIGAGGFGAQNAYTKTILVPLVCK